MGRTTCSKGRMEKFSLKWNDFETNISRSFKKLRQEEDFYDVTLVSDDHIHISSHKLVLSSSSDFFKTILRKSTHPNPMIYLTGVNSKELDFVIDYIYDGEVQIFQEDLNKFLAIAKILKIEGLVEHPLNQNDQNLQSFSNLSFPKTEEEEVDEKPTADFLKVEFPGENESKEKRRKKRRSVNVSTSIIDVKEAIEQLITNKEDVFECRNCGKTTTRIGDLRKHVEIHIDGLSYKCTACGNTFRNRVILSNHRKTCDV